MPLRSFGDTWYDVLKRHRGGLRWIEAVDDLEPPRLRIQRLSSASYDEYLVFQCNPIEPRTDSIN
jgi:hypothetical protein